MPRWSGCAVFAAILLSPAAASSQVVATITPEPAVVRIGEQVVFHLTMRNTGAQDAQLSEFMTVDSSLTFISASGPAGWNVRVGSNLEFKHQIQFGPVTLAPGASATVSARFQVPSTVWPGARLIAFALFFSNQVLAEAIVDGSGPVQASPSQLFTTGPEVTALTEVRARDLDYDSSAGSYLAVGTRASGTSTVNVLTALNVSGVSTGPAVELDGSVLTPPGQSRLAYSPAMTDGVNSGGFLHTWIQNGTVFARQVITQGIAAGSAQAISETATVRGSLSIAYSRTSRTFLVAWETSAGRVTARRVDLTGTPVGSILDVGAGSPTDVTWNPVTDEFGLAWSSGFARISTAGAILARLDTRVGQYLAVNTITGNYIAVGRRNGVLLGAEISRTGRVISRGYIGDLDSGPLSFNPVTETFVVADTSRMVELNRHGAPLSAPVSDRVSDVCGGGRIAQRTDTAEWRLMNATNHVFRMCTIGVGTFTRNGGSDARLGGCTTPDPFEAMGGGHCYDGGWLPPGMDVPGVPTPVIASPTPTPSPSPSPSPSPTDCATPDPFVALGGGTCFNGGWYPPGMLLPAPQPPPSPGGCLTPDPFVALGGGTCFNGGWYPPGMLPAAGR